MSPSLNVSVVVDIESLDLTADTLEINDLTAFEVIRIGLGGSRWIRDWATAPDVHGAEEVSRRLDLQTVPLAVRVKATTFDLLTTRSLLLLAAFSQPNYTITVTIEGQSPPPWRCFAADITPTDSSGGSGDGTLDKFSLIAKRQNYDIAVPRQPL